VLDGEGTASALAIGTTKVGIGTTSPTQELDVNGDIVSTTLTTSGAVTAGSVSTSGAVTGGSLDVSGNVVADEYALDQTGSSSSAVAIHAPATNELAIRTNSTEAMRIDSLGKVGIGTESPAKPLEIQIADDTAYVDSGVGNEGNALRVRNISQAPDSFSSLELFAGQTSAGGVNIARIFAVKESSSSTATSLAFTTRDSNEVLSEAMRIDSLGKVGINTVSPSAPLEVSSTTGGVIMPRMTTTQMNAISSPTDGEMIYNTTENKFYGRANGAWTALH